MSAALAPQPQIGEVQTSLNPYGQLIKMLMPRAICIAIFDAEGEALWLSDGCDGPDFQPLIDDALADKRSHGFVAEWGGDPTYVFNMQDDSGQLVGILILPMREPGNGEPRPFSIIQGMLRPALEVLRRELLNQGSIDDLQKDLSVRDADLALLAGTSAVEEQADSDDFALLLQKCVDHLGCSVGAILIPDKNISACRTADGIPTAKGLETLNRTHHHLLAWIQVQRRTVALNKAAPSGPLASMPYKILCCPILEGAQRVAGILTLFRDRDGADFDMRQIHIVELLARRVAHLLHSAYDPATGLLTRTALEKRSIAILGTSKKDAQHCVIYADIDRLHVLNENLGMHVGDEVIVRTADTLRRALSKGMLAARISGDRFAVFLPNCGTEEAQRIAGEFRAGLEHLKNTAEFKSVDISASLGIATLTDTKHPMAHALAAAEAACKAAKDRGRARVEVYQEADQSIIRRFEDVTMIGTLREALENDRFKLEAQPIVSTSAKGVRGKRFELLLRMIDPAGETIAPDKFLTAAERYQMAPAIDRWVVNYVLEILSSAADGLAARGVHFAVNISGQSIGDDEFPTFLENKLREYRLPPGLLSFELTETAAVSNIVRAEMLMRRLRDLGHEIALDDFGKGLSSLSYLKSLPVTYLKIDGTFIRDVVTNQRSQSMVSTIVQMAGTMGLQTTAECVESDAIRDTVARLGVTYAQGFSIGRPKALESVLHEVLSEPVAVARESFFSKLVG
jgi:diguanylate cyclase (GGDEF)-like protein